MIRKFVAVILCLFAAACSKDAAPSEHPEARAHAGAGDHTGEPRAEARVYAAASLTDAIHAIAWIFEPVRGSHVVAAFGASSTLAQQFREGAPPGVFVSASAEWVDKLEEWGLVEPGTRVDLLGNSLVVVVPKDAKTRPATLDDLADAKFARIALADPEHVPAGKYAEAALEKAGVFDGIKARVVAAQDVRTALAYVERGECDAGIVYATDAAASTKADVALRVPPRLHPKIVYPLVLVKGANRRARELYEFLRSDAAWAEFAKAGFTRPK